MLKPRKMLQKVCVCVIIQYIECLYCVKLQYIEKGDGYIENT